MSTTLAVPFTHPFDHRFPPGARVVCLGHAMKETLSVQMTRKAMELGARLGGAEVTAGLCISDGGDGFIDAFSQVRSGRREKVLCADPLGGLQLAEFLYDEAREEAAIEMARCCGMAAIPPQRRDIMNSGTAPLAELILRAMWLGARKIHIGLGGSATCDGGLGMLMKLESVLLEKPLAQSHVAARHHQEKLKPDVQRLREMLKDVEFLVYCDVQNPLLGPTGTAHLFAPQKGATPEQVETLEHWMTVWADTIEAAVGEDEIRHLNGTGAAGGVGFAFAALGATLRSGTDLFFQLIDLPSHLQESEGLITCEGRFDKSSLVGKAPWRSALLAREMKRKVLIACGTADQEALEAAAESGINVVQTAAHVPSERRTAEAFSRLQQAVERFLSR